MDVAGLPTPPALPPGLPQLPKHVQLPDWLACGQSGTRLDARARALATFGPLLDTVRHGGAGAQTFGANDLRIYSYDANNLNAYDTATTRQSLADSAGALAHEFAAWHRQEPRATFDIVGHSLGGVIALFWASTASASNLAYVHAIVTLDSPVAGYPAALSGYVHSYLTPLFGAVASALADNSENLHAVSKAPGRWSRGAGHFTNAIFNLSNLRDIVVPAFIATLGGADGLIEDYGTGPDAFNHGAVVRSSRALAVSAAVLQTSDGPQLSTPGASADLRAAA